MKTLISSLAFQNEAGSLLTSGSLILTLPSGIYPALGGGQIVGRSVIINLDGNAKVPAGTQVWASDELTPHTRYAVTMCAQANGVQVVGSTRWLIAGISPIDLSLLQNSN